MRENTTRTTVRVRNASGIHTRPATHIVKLLQNVKSEVYFTHKQERVDAKSILGILTLAAPKDAEITIEVSGEDAQETLERLVQAFEESFDEVSNEGGRDGR